MAETITITDDRTGQTVTVPIEGGVFPASAIRSLDPSLFVYDPAYMQTASCKSAITYLDGENGIKARAKRAFEGLKEKGGDIDKIEMRGLFSIGGQPKVSLSVGGGSPFFLQPGQTRRGMKLLRVEGDKDPCAILETKGRQIRVYLNATRRTELVPMVAMKGGGGVFLREMVPGKKWIFPLLKEDGTSCKVELNAQRDLVSGSHAFATLHGVAKSRK